MNSEEISRFIDEHGKSVYSFCCNLTGGRMEADDLYQDTFLKAFEMCRRLDSSDNPKSFVMGIAVNLWKNQCRKKAGRQRIITLQEYREEKVKEIESVQNMPEEQVIRREMQEEVRRIVGGLPEKIRMAMYLFYTAEMSVSEIAQTLHVPKGTVKSRLYKGRELTKQYLEVDADGKRIDQ